MVGANEDDAKCSFTIISTNEKTPFFKTPLSKRGDQDMGEEQAPEVTPSHFCINHNGSKLG